MGTTHPGRVATIARFPVRSSTEEIEDTGFPCYGGSWINQAIDDTIQLVRFTLLANGVPPAAALVVKAAIIAFAVWLQQQNRSR